jgi:hypothetical protein
MRQVDRNLKMFRDPSVLPAARGPPCEGQAGFPPAKPMSTQFRRWIFGNRERSCRRQYPQIASRLLLRHRFTAGSQSVQQLNPAHHNSLSGQKHPVAIHPDLYHAAPAARLKTSQVRPAESCRPVRAESAVSGSGHRILIDARRGCKKTAHKIKLGGVAASGDN